MRKFMTMLLVAGIATGAFATTEETSVEIRQTEETKVLVAVPTAPTGIMTVKITDSEDRLVLKDKITKAEAFAKRYDLNALPEGEYSIEVSDASGKVTSAKISTAKKVEPAVYSWVTQMQDNQYRLLVSTLDSKDVTVQIFDGDQLIHTEVVDNPQGLHKVYSIKKPGSPDSISFKVTTASGFATYSSAR